MQMIRRLWRLLSLVVFLLLGGVMTLLLLPDMKHGIPGGRVQKARQWWYRQILRIMGVELVVHGQPADSASLWVSNHISWLDIPLLGSLAPLGFLSKAEIRQWPIIGWLASSTGTLFIERGGKNASQKAARAIAEHINQGHSILVFPEAMTTAGVTVKRFHPRLFAPAIDHALKVQPVAIRYFHDDGSRHERLPFIDQQPFFSNLWTVLGEKRSRAEVTFFPPVDAGQYSERRPLAEHVHAQVLKAFD
jgi:1-acyl-sn-glycerol-3-phosphate acyltransferase